MFRKLEFDRIYYAYLNESPFKYFISILGWGVGGLRPCLFCLFRGVRVGGGVQNLGKPAYMIIARSLISYMQVDISLGVVGMVGQT